MASRKNGNYKTSAILTEEAGLDELPPTPSPSLLSNDPSPIPGPASIIQSPSSPSSPSTASIEGKPLKLNYVTLEYANSGNPEVWGPAFWFSLHNGALRYPVNAAPLWRQRMKHFILGIPVMVPCEKCSDHATAYIEGNYQRIDNVVSGREELFKFFWEFHNYVNKRLGKPIMTLRAAYTMYSAKTNVTSLQYDNS
jgi:hypothetical protein